jgi:hypothetical protein
MPQESLDAPHLAKSLQTYNDDPKQIGQACEKKNRGGEVRRCEERRIKYRGTSIVTVRRCDVR